jgi:hypothetical protein
MAGGDGSAALAHLHADRGGRARRRGVRAQPLRHPRPHAG